MKFLKIIVFHFLILLMYPINASAQEIYFENANLKNLPSTETYQVFQDSHGFIWIATDAGICRYDGTTNTVFTVKDGISENVVIKIYEDHKKRVWFSTLAGYFFYYENGSFHPIAANEELSRLTKPNSICSFLVGEQDTLYVTCGAKHGIMKIAPHQNYKTIIKQYGKYTYGLRFMLDNKINPSQTLSGGGVDSLTADSTYGFYFRDHFVYPSFKGIQGFYHSQLVGNMIKGKDGTAYLPCSNQLTVIKDNGNDIQYYFFPHDVLRVYEDRDGDLWVSVAKHGGYLYKQGNLKKKPIRFLTSLSISSFLLDKEKSLWVSTMEKGVLQCMNKHVLGIPEKASSFRVQDNRLTVTLSSAQNLVTFQNDTVYSSKHVSGIPPNAQLISFLEKDNVDYYGTIMGFYQSDHKGALSKIISPNGLPIGSRYIIEMEKDTLLIVTITFITAVVHNKAIYMIRQPFTNNFATRLSNKKIVFGSRNNEGIFEFKNKQFIPYLSQFKELKTRINWLGNDSAGNLWIATNEKGMYCYDHTGKLHAYNEKNGLISSKINSCTIDTEGNVWCGTFQGISKLIMTAGLDQVTIENFDKNHGLMDVEISNILAFDGSIWCSGKTALFYFKPDHIKKNTFAPPLYIKSLAVKNKAFPIQDSLTLDYNQNDFRVQCEMISFKKNATKTFIYKLNGYDKDWITSNTGDIRYTNIGHGNYTLSIYGLNNDGIKSDVPLQLNFIIKKPFWFTWYFILLEVLLFISAVYAITFYWKRRIEQRERAKAALNQKMAEFKMTALRAQMNPHFIFNAIGSIQHYILKNEITQSFNYLSKFSALIRNILNNSKNEYISLAQEINTLQLYIELEQIRFKYPFKFVVTIDEELDTEIEIPTMLIQPYVENSIWHGLMPKESEGLLELILKKQDQVILITIRDNGVGREKGNLEKKYHISKGMSLTAQRIETLERTSQKKFMTTIIDLKDEHGHPAGTEVNLEVPFDE